MIDIVELHKVNALIVPPLQIEALLQSPFIDQADLSSVWVVVIAGGQLDLASRSSFIKHLPNGAMRMLYAMTECGSISSTPPLRIQSNSCGKVAPNSKLKVVDDDGKALNLNETGEFYFKPSNKFIGYANNQEESENAHDENGWFKTGDLGYIDDDGEVFIVGRKKEVFDYMNFFIYPSELEACIAKLDGVESVCVIGIKLSAVGSLGAALVLKRKGSSIKEQDVEDEIKSEFRYKATAYITNIAFRRKSDRDKMASRWSIFC